MRHHNSVLHGLLKHIPWSAFDILVDEHRADAGVRQLSTKSQLVALLYAQLAGAVSLREIETAMASHSARLYHLGAREVSRSTLADANRLRPHAVFSGLFNAMVGLGGRGFARKTGEAVRLIDSTSIKLAGVASGWARFSTDVFDMGYCDFGWWAKLDQAGCCMVTRLKSNTKLLKPKQLPLPQGSELLYDRVGLLPGRMAKSRKNPFQDPPA